MPCSPQHGDPALVSSLFVSPSYYMEGSFKKVLVEGTFFRFAYCPQVLVSFAQVFIAQLTLFFIRTMFEK